MSIEAFIRWQLLNHLVIDRCGVGRESNWWKRKQWKRRNPNHRKGWQPARTATTLFRGRLGTNSFLIGNIPEQQISVPKRGGQKRKGPSVHANASTPGTSSSTTDRPRHWVCYTILGVNVFLVFVSLERRHRYLVIDHLPPMEKTWGSFHWVTISTS